MPVVFTGYGYINKVKARKAKKEYWIKKGCTEWKAEKLLFRYGY